MLFANRISSSTNCSIWRPETAPPVSSWGRHFQSCNTSIVLVDWIVRPPYEDALLDELGRTRKDALGGDDLVSIEPRLLIRTWALLPSPPVPHPYGIVAICEV